MTLLSVCLVAGVVGLGVALVRCTRQRQALAGEIEALANHGDELERVRAGLRRERKRARRVQRNATRAERLVGMVRTIAGVTDLVELAERTTRAVVDAFGVEGAELWSGGCEPELLGRAGHSGVEGSLATVVSLVDDAGQVCGTMRIELGDKRPAANLERYLSVVGVVMGACVGRTVAPVRFEEPVLSDVA